MSVPNPIPSTPVLDPGSDRISVSGILFPSAFRDVSEMKPEWRLSVLEDAAKASDTFPDDGNLKGLLRLCARAGVLDADLVVRSRAVTYLAELHNAIDRPWLLHGFSDPDSDVRSICIEGVGLIGDPSDKHALSDRLQDRSAVVRGAAVIALVNIFGKSAVDDLRHHLDKENVSKIRALCYYYMTKFNDLDYPLPELSYENATVSRLARRLLRSGDVVSVVAGNSR